METSAVPRPRLGKALLVVLVMFGLILGAFVVAGILLTWGLFLLPVFAAGSALYLVWATRRPSPPPPVSGAGTAAP